MAESIAAALAETQQCGASAEHAESAYKQRGDIAGFEAAGLSFAVCVCLDGACRCRGGLCRSSRLCRCSGGLRSSCGCTGRNGGLFCKAHRAGLQAIIHLFRGCLTCPFTLYDRICTELVTTFFARLFFLLLRSNNAILKGRKREHRAKASRFTVC